MRISDPKKESFEKPQAQKNKNRTFQMWLVVLDSKSEDNIRSGPSSEKLLILEAVKSEIAALKWPKMTTLQMNKCHLNLKSE